MTGGPSKHDPVGDHLDGVMPFLAFPTDGLELPPEPSVQDVWALIAATDRELAETQRVYYRVQRAKALARVAWLRHLDRTLVHLAGASAERRGAQADREALARRTRVERGSDQLGEDLHEALLVLEAHAEAVREHLQSLRARYSGLQSLLRSLVDRPML